MAKMKFEEKGSGGFLLDVCGFVCPHPQIYTKKALAKMKAGDTLELIFDNPSSGESITSMCDNTGDDIAERKQEGGKFVWKIVKG
jgi:tRNA 2-thiouridine synthesizing protein A